MTTSAWDVMLGRQLDYASKPLTRHALLLAHLDFAWDRLRPRLDGLTDSDDDLDGKPKMPDGWLDNRFPTAMNIQDITIELSHHGAEIALFRDLYRIQHG